MKGITRVKQAHGGMSGIGLKEGGPVRDGARSAPSADEVLEELEELVCRCRNSGEFAGLDNDEMLSIAWLEAHAALIHFKPGRGVGLRAYLKRRVRGALIASRAELLSGGLRPRRGSLEASTAYRGSAKAMHFREEEDPAPDPEQLALSSQVEDSVRDDIEAYLREGITLKRSHHENHLALFINIAKGIETQAEAAHRLGVSPARVGRICGRIRAELRERPVLISAIEKLAGR